jgi:hypothetical protein
VVIGYERKKGEAPPLLLADLAEGVGLRYVGLAIPLFTGQARNEVWEALEFSRLIPGPSTWALAIEARCAAVCTARDGQAPKSDYGTQR